MSKWLNKRTQAVTESLNKSAKRTQYDADFEELQQQCETTKQVVHKMLKETPNFLHPNPAARARTSMGSTYAKLRKTAAEKRYPHAIGVMAELLTKGAADMPPGSSLGSALREVGESFQTMTEAQHNFDAEVVQNFMEPLKDLVENDFKELGKQKRKLEDRRLAYDFKLRKRESGKSSITDADIKLAEEKFEDSKNNAENAMMKIVNNDVEQVGQLMSLVQAMITLARNQLETLEATQAGLEEILEQASTKPKRTQRPVSMMQYEDDEDDEAALAARGISADEPSAVALFDFEAENEGELTFKEGDTIRLLSRLDENWLEGEVDGQQGMFPVNYVEIIRDV
ncbi:endophilin [Salpingoeca rosetta]|uniref:Endophilin n=1 Tax=Salpingoeca rosetta (strain ATCC 50818 / BSB-021) TaxID=946362 RepID=F2TW40_SALR5|nr:endophilin [Salpingoeca rosetta]EGD72286.1 endophilin [Salpingoeca rosetta]|eukprot:XP_004998856.1 endophilin [Salpingoeca rosetta]